MSDRDVQGRFLPGHEGLPGAGRPKGSKQSLADQFIYDLAELWEREGKNILTQMAAEKPCELVRAVTRVLPRDNFARDNFSKGQFFQRAGCGCGKAL